uniref:Uncharacterized protein n=1 Tax=Oryza meridionalis TaxID=40149 RepID=A0A0E0EXU4_9ORYZ
MAAAGGGGGDDDDQRFDLPDDPPPAHPPARPIQGGRVDRRALAAVWGSLWRSSSAVNLAARVYFDGWVSHSVSHDEREEAFSSRRDAFVRASPGGARGGRPAGGNGGCRGVTRLTLDVQANCPATP